MAQSVRDTWHLGKRTYQQVPGEHYGTPKEVWGLRTAPVRGTARGIARGFLAANAELFGLEPRLRGLEVRRVIRSLGAEHVIFTQVHAGRWVHRAYVSVHMDRAGRVFLVKNRAVPARLLPTPAATRIGRTAALRLARATLPDRRRPARALGCDRLWFPRKAALLPAWKVRLMRRAPREEWIVYLDARTGKLLSRYDNLAAAAAGRGLVFDPSPVTALGDHAPLLTPKRRPRRPPPAAYREVRLLGLAGDGTLRGARVTTEPTRARIRRPSGDFRLRSHQRGFEEVMVYFHLDAVRRYLERLGFRGACAIFRAPVRADVNGTREDNSWYSPAERLLTFGTGDIDDAEDAETIVHELGHALQDAICPDFGQSAQAAAMGEGFGDYLAASVFEARKPARYRASVMTWDGLPLGLAGREDPPALRRVDGRGTGADFDARGDEHDNGLIWSAVLWDVRAAVGRETADRLIVESHFQLDAFTTFARGARAILDADRNLYRGRHVAALRRVFRRRKIAPL